MNKERIAKVIAHRGFCSRREAESLIAAQQVFVDGDLVTTPALKVHANANISIAGSELQPLQDIKLWAFYKPVNCITTHSDPYGRETLFSLLPPSLGRVISVGRLDYGTEGLILLSNNGEVTRKLELPQSKIVRVYRCRVYGFIPKHMIEDLSLGIEIDGVNYASIECTIDFSSGRQHWLSLYLTEGKNREIRRICTYFGLQVSRLIRVQYGNIKIGNLQPGEIRRLSASEISTLCDEEAI